MVGRFPGGGGGPRMGKGGGGGVGGGGGGTPHVKGVGMFIGHFELDP